MQVHHGSTSLAAFHCRADDLSEKPAKPGYFQVSAPVMAATITNLSNLITSCPEQAYLRCLSLGTTQVPLALVTIIGSGSTSAAEGLFDHAARRSPTGFKLHTPGSIAFFDNASDSFNIISGKDRGFELYVIIGYNKPSSPSRRISNSVATSPNSASILAPSTRSPP